MRQNACYFCDSAAKNAWRVLTIFFNTPTFDGVRTVEYYSAILLLAYRVSIQEEHGRAGHVLQALLGLPDRSKGCLEWARMIEKEEPVRYPKYIQQLVRKIEESK